MDLASALKLRTYFETKERLEKMSGGRPNDGVILETEIRDYNPIENFETFIDKYTSKSHGNIFLIIDQKSTS